jgi:hypothetical protein
MSAFFYCSTVGDARAGKYRTVPQSIELINNLIKVSFLHKKRNEKEGFEMTYLLK